MIRFTTLCLYLVVTTFGLPITINGINGISSVLADEGQPIAVIVEPEGCAIETMGGFRIAIDSTQDSRISIGELSNFQTTAFQPAHELITKSDEQTSWHLSRQFNQLKSTCQQAIFTEPLAGNVVLIHQRKHSPNGQLTTRIEADGVVILNLGLNSIQNIPLPGDAECDVLVATHCVGVDNESVKRLVEKLRPQIVLIAASNESVSNEAIVTLEDRNVVAVSAKEERKTTRWIKISNRPWTMPDSEMGQLFRTKEASSAQSRAVFAELSVDQMNFVPSDGSHTPRWNTEHMMGRELLFFSQIYHHVDPSIPVMNLNPKQMPEDYVAAHPDWTGHEEALLTLQVEAFSRRFAYLMEALPLDEKTQGSKMWSPRGLLEQMERHYKQHTDNVRKKMNLKNWPTK